MGTACYIKGAPALLAEAEKSVGLRPGETTADGKVSFLTARCLGSCSLAPAVVFDGEVAGGGTLGTTVARLQRWLSASSGSSKSRTSPGVGFALVTGGWQQIDRGSDAQAIARFVSTAHASGRGVTLDVVYNHSLGSSVMRIAPDVYRNGDYDGDRMNCGHPMVGEYFRQASVYLFRTFNLDGLRFDDTQTIVAKCLGGWEFLGMIRLPYVSGVRGGAALAVLRRGKLRHEPVGYFQSGVGSYGRQMGYRRGLSDQRRQLRQLARRLGRLRAAQGRNGQAPNIGDAHSTRRPALANRTTW